MTKTTTHTVHTEKSPWSIRKLNGGLCFASWGLVTEANKEILESVGRCSFRFQLQMLMLHLITPEKLTSRSMNKTKTTT